MKNRPNDVREPLGRSGSLPDFPAAFYLLLAHTALALVPYPRIVRWMVTKTKDTAKPDPVDIFAATGIRNRLAALIQRFPALGACIPHAVAAVAMLRRRGVRANVRFGILRNPPSGLPLEAHVWVTVGDVVVAGESVMSAFTELAPLS